MTWFPKEQNIPPDTNVPGIDVSALVCNAFKRDNQVNADDVTFIIPFSADSEIRRDNLMDCLCWIFYNTTAKVSLHWCETKENFFNPNGAFSEVHKLRPELLGRMWELLKENESVGSEKLKDVFKATKKIDSEVAGEIFEDDFFDIFTDMFLLSWVPLFRALNQPGYNDQFGAQVPGQLKFPTEGLDDLVQSIRSRFKLSFEERPQDKPFHRTRYLNRMLDTVDTKITCNHDADIILPHDSFKRALALFEVYPAIGAVYPYDHGCNGRYQVRLFDEGDLRKKVKLSIVSGDLTQVVMHESACLWSGGYGQSVLVKTDMYKSAGGENEEFISWGAEDVERYVRLIKLGVNVARVKEGYILHLEHPRGKDSERTNPYFEHNEDLWKKLQVMDNKELSRYYLGCEYLKNYDWIKG